MEETTQVGFMIRMSGGMRTQSDTVFLQGGQDLIVKNPIIQFVLSDYSLPNSLQDMSIRIGILFGLAPVAPFL